MWCVFCFYHVFYMWCVFVCSMYFICSVYFTCSVFICGVSLCAACILYVVCILYAAVSICQSQPPNARLPPCSFLNECAAAPRVPAENLCPRPAGAHSRPFRPGWTLPCPGSARGVSEQARIRLLLAAGLLTVPSGGFLCS